MRDSDEKTSAVPFPLDVNVETQHEAEESVQFLCPFAIASRSASQNVFRPGAWHRSTYAIVPLRQPRMEWTRSPVRSKSFIVERMGSDAPTLDS